jgi:hypothetical protein
MKLEDAKKEATRLAELLPAISEALQTAANSETAEAFRYELIAVVVELETGLRIARRLADLPEATGVDSDGLPTNKPPVQLSGGDGNVFAVLGACRRAARNAGWSTDQLATFRDKVINASDYGDVIALVHLYFTVS